MSDDRRDLDLEEPVHVLEDDPAEQERKRRLEEAEGTSAPEPKNADRERELRASATGNVRTMIDEAWKHEGYREKGKNDTKFNRWFGQIPPYPHDHYGYPWCHSFLTYCLWHSGNANVAPRTAGCENAVGWFRNRNCLYKTPQIGDFVYYGSDGGTHVELVIAVTSTKIRTIGGNTFGHLGGNYFNGDGVYVKWVDRKKSSIYGYGRPFYKPAPAEPEVPSDGTLIRQVGKKQVYLVDGGRRRPIPDLPTFESKWEWAHVRDVSRDVIRALREGPRFPALTDPIANGDLIRSRPGRTVYLVQRGKRRAFPNQKTFLAKYRWHQVRLLDPDVVAAIPLGDKIPPMS